MESGSTGHHAPIMRTNASKVRCTSLRTVVDWRMGGRPTAVDSCDGFRAALDATGWGLAGCGPTISIDSPFGLHKATSSIEGAGPHIVEHPA